MKLLDLFSGIGGFSLGLERAGFETIAFCEIEDFPRKVLKKHWPDIPIARDIHALTYTNGVLYDDGREIYKGAIDIICGGYPCQPFSVAGKQRGAEDDRHLWPEYLRLIQEIKPRWIIAENVAGHINMGLDEALSDLENESYTWEAFIIPACALNAHHRRDRVWIIANANSSGCRESNEKMEGKIPEQSDSNSFQSTEVNTNASGDRLQGSSEKQIPRVSHIQSQLVGGCEAVGILPHPLEPGISGITDGFPGRVDRIKGLGNAVVPQIPEIIGRAIMEASIK